MLMACAEYDRDKALAAGLVDRPGSLDVAMEWAAEMARLAPLTVRYNKRVLNAALAAGTDAANIEADLMAAFESCWASRDSAEGRAARVEKRPPQFQAR